MPTKSVADEDMAIQLTGRLDSRLLTDRNKSIKTCLYHWGNLGSRKTMWWGPVAFSIFHSPLTGS